ncbi:MAG: hypothetical protein ACLRTA_00460 [Clostridia bacterium]
MFIGNCMTGMALAANSQTAVFEIKGPIENALMLEQAAAALQDRE